MANELDTKIQILLNKIQIAHEGHIITSEYHNSLRDALLALAERIGLTVKPVSETRILTFAPNFLPTPERDISRWFISFSKAVIHPKAVQASSAIVRGAFIVQLPDDTTVKNMIVRGARFAEDEDKPNPKSFQVALYRMKLDIDGNKRREAVAQNEITPLVVFDLADRKGKIKEENNIKNSLPDDLDEATRYARAADLSRVDNKRYQYFIAAEWIGGREIAQFEIHSLQIIC